MSYMVEPKVIYILERWCRGRWLLSHYSPHVSKKAAEGQAKDLTARYVYALYRVRKYIAEPRKP